jgi:nitrite reductase (NADH) small subunit/3-phenylpropionate/trans-cinnamate dioxygenase ferredoxin subunit
LQDASEKFHTVARVGEIVEGRGEPFEVAGKVIAIFLHGGRYYAVDDTCPHQGAPLCDGALKDGAVTCAWHEWRFGLADGRRVDKPKVRVGTYAVRVAGDEIQVAIG